jgi:hypothetical protein
MLCHLQASGCAEGTSAGRKSAGMTNYSLIGFFILDSNDVA